MRNKVLHILLLSASLLLISSCMSTNFGFHIPENSRDQFVRILQQVQISICVEEGCTTNPMKSSGSGVVVDDSLKGSYVLTAGHVCELEIDRIVPPDLMKNVNGVKIDMIIVNLAQSKYNAEIISIDPNSDLCLLFAKGYWNEEGPVDMADVAPFEGERVYNVAAPVGIFYENVVPLLEGFYMGKNKLRAYYSIPAMGGSSGSPVLNIRGDLIGMVHSVNVAFPMVSVSPTYSELKKFIKFNVNSHKKSKKENKQETRAVEPFWKFLGLDRI